MSKLLFYLQLRDPLDFILSTMHFFFSGLVKRSVSPPMTDWGRVAPPLVFACKSLFVACVKRKKPHECAK